ncbi:MULTISPECIES: hypothetical protein [unclassified Tolypothrix]|uniref:hypothetical protein n=1 Tax=unclassified Tolypothrix TaxID=2649714 RepID=UPI0005EAC2CE|nr:MULTISPECIES: hypothetical protein [unclassified Tolypothrix]BAY32919.1 hypothetical protein NIES2107_48130 [Nostoc carneum NIES-2107]BAY88192.1 hypothetical protein NIES3275_01670 [Microchaete diplosiphon NIES-3275]EKF02055.1 hypothetical protein FDUTEX481_07306 [Tolypothrix sp. PCC 7601]MBE9085647.1 hypothetical protein [Tolypothrix sp. LEGE 11397]UYD28895.1 hypothetical protein HGR01_13160 [Tolypothrix sp. PCC 7712]
MEPLQKQITTLSHKLDNLCQVIEELDGKVTQTLSECSLAKTQARDNYPENTEAVHYQFRGNLNYNPEMEHKDVLADGIYSDMNRQGGEKTISPEIQIQRLTAQLTAAYNRIAALEEQLLRERIH